MEKKQSASIWRERLRFLCRISIKTIYFNFHYLPLSQAIHMPFLISKKVYFKRTFGSVILELPPRFGLIQIGFGDVGIFDYRYSRTIWDVSGSVVFKGKTRLGHGTKIAVGEHGTLLLGHNFTISGQSSIVAFHHVSFGNDCLLSWDTLIMDTDLHNIKDINGTVVNTNRPVKVGNHVWIGCRCLILKGTVIPDNCIIGANSHLNKPLEKENSVYTGNPARLISENKTWEN